MHIVRDASIEQWIHTETCNNWGKGERDGIHLSDLLAPRKAYFQKIDPKHPTFHEVCYWMSGNAVEDKFLGAIGYEHGEQREWNGILYTPDMFLSFPAELKSRRRGLAKVGEEVDTYDHYLRQLRGYCAIVDSTQGWLLVLSLVEKQADHTTKPELAAYRIEFTQEELSVERTNLLVLRDKLLWTIQRNGLPDIYLSLPECPSWMCGRKTYEVIEKPACRDCGMKEFASEANIKKHAVLKKHEIVPGKYKEVYEVSCKWFYQCVGKESNGNKRQPTSS